MPRLDSKLSRLLLDTGRLSVPQLEEAAQQQVIHGGALDTLLLELALLDEATLTETLANAWLTEPVDVKAIQLPDGQAASWIPERMAVRMGLCPFKEEGAELHVLVPAPVDYELLEEVGQLVGKTLVPHAVPEARLMAALGRLYDVPVEERFVSLIAHLDQGLDGPIRAPHEDDAETAVEQSEWDLVEALANLAAQDNRQGISRVALQFARQFLPFAAIFGVRGDQAVGWARSGGSEGAQFGRVPLPVPDASVLRQVLDSPSPLLGKPPIGPGNHTFLGWLGRRRPRTALLVPIIVARRTVALLYADGGVRARNYDELSDLVAFGARLGPAFEALLRVRHRENEALFGPRSEEVTDPRGVMPSSAIQQDGTSPFARGYKREVTVPPEKRVAATLKMDGDGQWSMVIESEDEHRPAPVEPAPASAPDLHGWGDAVAEDNDAAAYGDDGVSSDDVFDDSAFDGPTSVDDGTADQHVSPDEVSDLGPFDLHDTVDGELTSPYGSQTPTQDGDPTGPSPAPPLAASLVDAPEAVGFGDPEIDWENDEEEEDITFEGTLTDEPAVPATLDDAMLRPAPAAPAARPAFKPLGANVGLDRSHSEIVLPSAGPEIRPLPPVAGSPYQVDELEPEEDVTYDDEITGMFPVGVVSPEQQQHYDDVIDDLQAAEAKLQEDETGGFRNLLASVKDDLSGPNPTIPTKTIDIAGLRAAAEARGELNAGPEALGEGWARPQAPEITSDPSASADWATALNEAAHAADSSAEPAFHDEGGWDDVVLDHALAQATEAVDAASARLDAEASGEGLPVADGLAPAPAPAVKGQLEILDDGQSELPTAAQLPLDEPIALTKPKLSPDEALSLPNAGLDLSDVADSAPPALVDEGEVVLHTADVEVAQALDAAPAGSGLELDSDRASLQGARVLGDTGEAPAPSKPPEPTLTIDDAAEMLQSTYKARVREAQDYLRAQGQAAIPALAGRFPGRLLVDPFASERVLTATGAELGPMMELLQSMGPLGLEAAIPHLDAPQPGHRFCATFLFKLVPDERCLDLLKKRLHDHEPNIRLAAAAAMDEFIAHPRFAHVLQHLRDRLSSPSPEAQERAIVLLGQFSDVGSVPTLIDLLEDAHAGVRAAAHVALCDICLVNHGKKAKAWLKWWDKARKRSRVDWVIDALRSRDESVRRVARVELCNLTGGDAFGYEPMAAKRDREKAVRAVESWWEAQRAALSA